uniref:Uncharacterized protein n=1 Tax=Brassica oleracea TaxID=3712 RepID=A0A3P6ALD1_BRAOL|nr:unnamed protein product [Brassica oleracea]
MTSQLRASARLANKPKHNSVYLKKLKNASEFSISRCHCLCLCS